MTILKGIYLYWLSGKASFKRLKHNLAHELVNLFASLVVFSTFLYIFDDFINHEVLSISENMRNAFAEVLAYIALAIATWVCSKLIYIELSHPYGFAKNAQRLGEQPSAMQIYLSLKIFTILLIWFGSAWFISLNFLINWPLEKILSLQLLCGTIVALILYIITLRQHKKFVGQKDHTITVDETLYHYASKTLAMLAWRLKQILVKNRISQVYCLVALLFLLVHSLLIAWQAAFFINVMASFLAGWFSALAMANQLTEDLKYAWSEKTMGVSHQEFVATYNYIGIILGGVTGSLAFIIYLGLSYLRAEVELNQILMGLKLVFIAITPPLTFAFIMFQVDPQKTALQGLILFLISLFLITAIYAHWLAILLIPAFKYFADQTQQGRFYRAQFR